MFNVWFGRNPLGWRFDATQFRQSAELCRPGAKVPAASIASIAEHPDDFDPARTQRRSGAFAVDRCWVDKPHTSALGVQRTDCGDVYSAECSRSQTNQPTTVTTWPSNLPGSASRASTCSRSPIRRLRGRSFQISCQAGCKDIVSRRAVMPARSTSSGGYPPITFHFSRLRPHMPINTA